MCIRDSLMIHLKNRGVATGVHFTPLTKQPYYTQFEGKAPIAESLYKEICTLPLHGDLQDEDVDYILNELNEFSNSTH